MESRISSQPQTISDLLALSEVEEGESYEDLDQLLNTAIDHNDDDGEGDNTTSSDIEKILQSVEVSTTFSPTLNNAISVAALEPANVSTVIPSLPNDGTSQEKSEFSSSSLSYHIGSNDDIRLSSSRMSLSPTTLLNSLLSQSDADRHSGKNHDSSVLRVPSLSVDDTAVFMNANMEMSKSFNVTNDEMDTSLFDDSVHNKTTVESPVAIPDKLVVSISSDDDDGMNSFVTAREEGDATSSVHTKDSTVATASVENMSSLNDTLRNSDNYRYTTRTGIPDTTNVVDVENDVITTTIDQQITGSVSFHQAIDENYKTISAPLWDDDDPSTPKRSGREVILPSLNKQNDKRISNTIAQNIDATTKHQNLTIENTGNGSSNANATESIQSIDISDNMGNFVSECDKDATTENDTIDSKGVIPLTTDLSSAVVTTGRSLAINHLSVPCLSRVNSTDSKISHVRDENHKPAVSDIPDNGAMKQRDHDDILEETLTSDLSQVSIEEVAIPGSKIDASKNKAAGPISDAENIDTCGLLLHLQELDDESRIAKIAPILNAEIELGISDEPILSTDNLSSLYTDTLNSCELPKPGSELKSLQIECTSLMNKCPKQSDVSLSSASSTISHGSFNKAKMSSAIFAQALNDEQQHRRNKSNESLPPRSPRKGTTLLDSQMMTSSSQQHLTSIDIDENDSERVESKWMKQSLSTAFNPRRSIFAGKKDTKGRLDSISPPGSPPEPCYAVLDGEDADSFHDETGSTSSSGIKRTTAPGLWDMIADDELISDKHWVDKTDYVTSDHGNTFTNLNRRNNESIAESSVSPSEVDMNKSKQIATKLSFKSDISFSSSVVKRAGVNRPLSLSQHSKGSYCSTRSGQGKKEKRLLLSPICSTRLNRHASKCLELDTSSLGRYSSLEPSSPERIPPLSMHSSSPDLYKLNEESQSSYQASPMNRIKINALEQPETEIGIEGICLIAEAQPHDLVSPESLVQKYSLYQENNIMKRDENVSNLQELLLEFSTIRTLDLPLRNIALPCPLQGAGSLKWRQLVANWKHSEMVRAMTAGTSYSPIFENTLNNDGEMNSVYSDASVRPTTNISDNLMLCDVPLLPKSGKLDPQNRNPTLSTFLIEIGSGIFETSTNRRLLHHVSGSGTIVNTLDQLYETARKNVHIVKSIINDVIAFASIDNSNQSERDTLTYSIDVKDRVAIERKAKMKYNGDISQVKDILRAQITFRNDGELVCGLIRLLQIAKTASSTDTVSCERVTLIRMKNLFSCTPGCVFVMPPLPTGYRHVLLNFRLQNGLIFELQFNLSPIFKILGQEGYLLHRALIDTDDCLNKKDLGSEKLVAFDMNELIAETISCGPEKFNFKSFFDATNISKENETVDEEGERCKNSTNDSVESTKSDVVVLNEKSISGISDIDCDNTNYNNSLDAIVANLETLDKDTTGGDIFVAILQCASNDLSRSPRDVASYWCVYALFSFVLKLERNETIASTIEIQPNFYDCARQCLLQCLTIANQVVSSGMTGWLEYGSSNSFYHFAGQPHVVLGHLAYDFACDNRWTDADSVCRAWVIRCEEHLPLHHPATLTALVDLALSSSMVGNQSFADRIITRAAERLSKYLFDVEKSYVGHLSTAKPLGKLGETLFRIEHDRDAIFALHAFASLFQRQLKRDMVSLVGLKNEIVLANHCLVADTLSVLANCIAAANFFLGSKSDESDDCSLQYWQMAYWHYEICYTGLTATKNLDDPSVTRSIFGIARCLREFRETEKALKLLSLVVAFRGDTDEKPMSDRPLIETLQESKVEDYLPTQNQSMGPIPRFLPIVTPFKTGSDKSRISKSLSLALCLWLMSILSVDNQRNEEGRERAFGYLHAASMTLQASLYDVADVDDDTVRGTCIRFLAMIENEAEQISEPMYE